MKKTLQKGFSLVELLVVVAIIGVLAGVGIVGYQSYTDSAKSRVAVANFNSVKRFVETELTLLNNNIQTVSGAISASSSDCTASSLSPYTVYSESMTDFARGLSCYFATNGYGNQFKNPYDAAGGNGVLFNASNADIKKGNINIRVGLTTGATYGGAIIPTTAKVNAALSSGAIIIEYYTADGTAGVASTGEYKAKLFELK